MRAGVWAAVAAIVLFGCGGKSNGGGGSKGGAVQHTLTVHIVGSGQVQSSSPAFSCSADCQRAMDATTTVQLVAVPASTSTFSGWQGACSGTGSCAVSMSADMQVTATFSALPPGMVVITVTPIGTGSGRVMSTPAGVDCPGSCSMPVSAGTKVSLAAQPDTGSTFTGWGGGCSGNGGCSVTASSDVTVWANFTTNVPPAQCAGLAPGATPAAKSISNPANTNFEVTCMAGMGDPNGTLGLENFNFGRPMPNQFFPAEYLHIVDSVSGQQVAVASHVGDSGFFAPTTDGFIGFMKHVGPPLNGAAGTVEYWNHLGNQSHSDAIFGAAVFAGTPFGTALLAGDFHFFSDPSAHQLWMFGPNSAVKRCGATLASPGTVFGLGGTEGGSALVITDGGSGNIDAQWFGNTCTPLTGVFRLITGFQAGPNTWFETAALIGGGIAVRRVDQIDEGSGVAHRTAQWLVTLANGSATPASAPKWLTDRPNTNLAIARSGAAYAMLPMGAPGVDCAQKVDVLAPDGTFCGLFDAPIADGKCRTEDFGLGRDGTPVQLLPRSSPDICAYRWWPSALR